VGTMPEEWTRRLKSVSHTEVQLAAEPLNTPRFDYVLQPCQPAVFAVAEIAVNRYGRSCRCRQLFRPHEPNRVGQPRMASAYAVALPQAATRQQCEAFEHAVVEMRHETQVVAIDVGCVLALIREANLELAWQVSLSVQWVLFSLEARGKFAIKPDLEIRLCTRLEFARKFHYVSFQVLPLGGDNRRRAAHNVSNHIAARGKRGQIDAMQARNQLRQGALADVVILESLARSNAQRAIAYFIGEPVQFQILLRAEPPTRNSHADHGAECPLRLQLSQV